MYLDIFFIPSFSQYIYNTLFFDFFFLFIIVSGTPFADSLHPFTYCICSSMTSWTPSSSHPRPSLWLSPCSWTTPSTTRTAPGTEECRGGPSSGRSRGTAETRSSTRFPSISTVSSLLLEGSSKGEEVSEENHRFLSFFWLMSRSVGGRVS